jgi:hypothetical protein
MEPLISEAEMKARYTEIRSRFFPEPGAKTRAVRPYAKRHGKVPYVGKEERREGTGLHWAAKRAEKSPA